MKTFLVALSLLLFPVAALADVDTSSAVEVLVGDGHGSGVYVGNGYVLTAAHVAVNGLVQPITVSRQRDAAWTDSYDAKVVWIDQVRDFAILKINAVEVTFKAAKIECTEPTLGQDVTVAGWPADLGLVISKGYIAGGKATRAIWEQSFIMVGAIFFGNSGGPVYADSGRVIGLAVGMLQGSSLGIVIPTSVVCEVLPFAVK